MTTETARAFHCPRWDELPDLLLYMDQVVMVLTEVLAPFAEGDKAITSTMVNNYVKQKVISAPEKKRYGRRQLSSLIVVFTMKRVFSMTEIACLKRTMKDQLGMERAYDIFCEALEDAVRATFVEGHAPTPAPYPQSAKGALEAAMATLMGKMYLQDLLAKIESGEVEPGTFDMKPVKVPRRGTGK